MPNSGTDPKAYHAMTAEETLAVLRSSFEGLTADEAAARLAESGPNELPREPKRPASLAFLKQFHSGLVYILFAAAAISVLTGHHFDAAAILLVIVANAVIGFVQERKAEEALEKLRNMVVPTVTVRRGGSDCRVPVAEVVPGDVVLVAQGDRAAADLRLIEVRDLRADESALTGESVPVEKAMAPVADKASLGDRLDMLHMGTLVTSGEGAGVVVATGARTVFGGIAGSLVSIAQTKTPLEKRIDRLGQGLALLAVVFSAVILGIGLVRGLPILQMFLVAVAAAVSAIPEGLPAVLAVTLAIGVQRMAAKNAITRRLPAVETLGIVDVIVTDKTGTLTENKMTVRRVFTLDHDVRVSGEGWAPEGDFTEQGRSLALNEHPVLVHLLRAATVCNKAGLELRAGRWTALGDPTEAALLVLGEKGGFRKSDLLREERTLDEIPFSSERKYRAVLHEYVGPNNQRRREIMVVGALEVLLGASGMVLSEGSPSLLSDAHREAFHKANESLAGEAMRVLGVAVRQVDIGVKELREDDIRDLTLLGLVGMIDPPRKGVADAVRRCRMAGVRIMMNTGDHKATAVAIAREIGLFENGAPRGVLTDEEVVKMDDAALRKMLSSVAVFARVSPQTKLRVVRLLQAEGHVVAMTGDGINDAPALKLADIGVAMGITGTDVTKEVADMILSDDNFISIVNAVEEGRIIFRNVKQTTAYLVMTNAGEILTMIVAVAAGWPLPLLPAQLLWLNLVTDGFNTVALATEGRHGDELSRPPRRREEPILTRNLLAMTAMNAVIMAAGSLWLFQWALRHGDVAYARTVAFLAMALFQLWNVFSMRSAKASILQLGFLTNRWILGSVAASLLLVAAIIYIPFFEAVFGLVPVGLGEWAMAAVLSSTVLLAVEAWKVMIWRGIIPSKWI